MRGTEKILLALPFDLCQGLGDALFGSLSLQGSEQNEMVIHSLFSFSFSLSVFLFLNISQTIGSKLNDPPFLSPPRERNKRRERDIYSNYLGVLLREKKKK